MIEGSQRKETSFTTVINSYCLLVYIFVDAEPTIILIRLLESTILTNVYTHSQPPFIPLMLLTKHTVCCTAFHFTPFIFFDFHFLHLSAISLLYNEDDFGFFFPDSLAFTSSVRHFPHHPSGYESLPHLRHLFFSVSFDCFFISPISPF